MTELLCFHFSLSCIGEGNGNPLLENPRDGGAWWAAICGITQSRIRLKQLSRRAMKPVTHFLPSNVDWPHCLQLSPCCFILCLLFYFLQILLNELGTWGHLPHPTRADIFLSSYGDSPGMTAIPTRFSRIPLLCWKPQDGMTQHSPLLEFGMRPLSPLRMWPVDQGPSSNRAQEARLILRS